MVNITLATFTSQIRLGRPGRPGQGFKMSRQQNDPMTGKCYLLRLRKEPISFHGAGIHILLNELVLSR